MQVIFLSSLTFREFQFLFLHTARKKKDHSRSQYILKFILYSFGYAVCFLQFEKAFYELLRSSLPLRYLK